MTWRHRGPMESATSWTPSQPCGMQMLTSEILLRSREEGCQQNLTEALSREDTGLPWGKPYCGRIHKWDYAKGNQAIRTRSAVRVRRPHDWASPGCEQRAVTWTVCDSRGGDGGRAVTCGVIEYLPAGWWTRQPQCCPCGLTRACPTAVAGTAVRLNALPTALGSWCAEVVGALSRAPRLPDVACSAPAHAGGICFGNSMPGHLF